ncbi:ESX secretion-associated protein EspG [Nocardia sp. CA2R105]|uniref:ESX secretion-associated protein EspG n=1 Tax=Nocardia coffeae TaxID=2873381 RepID=UPI001CA62596|nr:ESX secretion-associated protein EspG [Nocardia coffeae]MBY8858553.1 ESX secretion-associated protein EspG [Nocardia coffeae]
MRTRSRWQFTPDEFAYVWTAETGSDEIPFPINILESPSTGEEYTRLRTEISARHPRHGDPDLVGPLRTVADPDLRIVSWGRFHNSDRRIRALTSVVADLVVVLFQKPGESTDFGGDLILVVARRERLGHHVAATLPPMRPGKTEQLIGYTPRVRGDQPPRTWRRDNLGQQPVEERIRLLLRTPRTAEGYLRVESDLHQPPQYISWLDIAPDHRAAGRYLITVGDDDTIVTPASAQVIAREVDRRAQTWTGLHSRRR